MIGQAHMVKVIEILFRQDEIGYVFYDGRKSFMLTENQLIVMAKQNRVSESIIRALEDVCHARCLYNVWDDALTVML